MVHKILNTFCIFNPVYLSHVTSQEVHEKDEDPLSFLRFLSLVYLPSLLSLSYPMNPSNKSMARDKHKSPVEVTYRKQFEPAHLS